MTDASLRATRFAGRLLVVGTGCVAESVWPLLWRHVELPRAQVSLLGPRADGEALAARHGIGFERLALTRDNLAHELAQRLRGGDFLLNLALGVGSLDLLDWCQQHDVVYLDSNLEPWSDRPHTPHEARSAALLRRRAGTCTAVLAHGANPGLVTHFLKQALCELAPRAARCTTAPTRDQWAGLARQLGVRVVQVTEFDSHTSRVPPSADEFANTWSARGLAGELCLAAEFGWGDHEPRMPPDANELRSGQGRVAVLKDAAELCIVRSWTPAVGAFDGFLVAHHESVSISDLLTPAVGAGRPTVFYAVRPCPAAARAARALRQRAVAPAWRFRVVKEELDAGGNELGVLLLNDVHGYWYGSRLDLAEARRRVGDNNATSLQVAAGVLGGLVWALENPRRGVVEAEDMDFRRVLDLASPYLGSLAGVATAWRPGAAAGLAFERFRY